MCFDEKYHTFPRSAIMVTCAIITKFKIWEKNRLKHFFCVIVTVVNFESNTIDGFDGKYSNSV